MAATFSVSENIGLEESVRRTDSDVLQQTLASTVKLTGTGLHSGGYTRVYIHPAEDNTGIVFTDGRHSFAGVAANVVDTSRGTSIGLDGTRIRTVEHVLSALRGCGVDNAIVEVDGPELPALDGSALPYVEAIDDVGMVEGDSPRKRIVLTQPVYVRQNGTFVLAVPAQRLSLTYVLSYDHPMIGSQTIVYDPDEDDFGTEIAPARTFVLYEEVAGLLNDGLSRGGSIDNVIVVWRDHMSSRLRFPDELARHKVVDLLGDLSLMGGSLQAEVLAVKSGHALNVDFVNEVIRVMGP